MSRLKEPSTWAGVSGAAAALAGAPLALLVPVQPWLALLSALADMLKCEPGSLLKTKRGNNGGTRAR